MSRIQAFLLLFFAAAFSACGSQRTVPSSFPNTASSLPAPSSRLRVLPAAGHLTEGNVYVGIYGDPPAFHAAVAIYPFGSTKRAYTTTNGLTRVLGVAVDSSGNLYVASGCGNPPTCVDVYALGSKTPSYTIMVPDAANYNPLALDSSGNLYLLTESQVSVYAPGAITPLRTIPITGGGVGAGIALDGTGNLYVGIDNNTTPSQSAILVYEPESTTLFYAISHVCYPVQGSPVAVSASGTLYVEEQRSTCGTGTADAVSVYAPGQTKRSYSFVPPNGGGETLAVDASGNLYVAGSTTDVYAPGAVKPSYHLKISSFSFAFDSSGNIYITSSLVAPGFAGVAAYAPGKTSRLYTYKVYPASESGTDSVAVGP